MRDQGREEIEGSTMSNTGVGVDERAELEIAYLLSGSGYDISKCVILDDLGRAQAARDAIRNQLHKLPPSFVANRSQFETSTTRSVKELMASPRKERVNELVAHLLGNNLSRLIDDTIDAYGYGHFLSPYDEELPIELSDGRHFYAYPQS